MVRVLVGRSRAEWEHALTHAMLMHPKIEQVAPDSISAAALIHETLDSWPPALPGWRAVSPERAAEICLCAK